MGDGLLNTRLLIPEVQNIMSISERFLYDFNYFMFGWLTCFENIDFSGSETSSLKMRKLTSQSSIVSSHHSRPHCISL